MSTRIRPWAIGAALGAAAVALPAGVAWGVSTALDDDAPGGGTAAALHRAQQPGAAGPWSTTPRDGSGAGPRDDRGQGPAAGAGSAAGPRTGPSTEHPALCAVTAGATLDADDAADLMRMAEEEKLARDLYLAFDDRWDLVVLERVAAAEQRHLDAVRALLDAYGLDDPTDGAVAGELSDPGLQELYDELLDRGTVSETAALEAAALVEETDIADLRALDPDAAAVERVYDSLETGSERHLTAFVTRLDAAGVDYEAQVLSAAEVASITGATAP